MNINWKVRFSNKMFWISIIPASILVIEAMLALFGITFEFEILEMNLIALVNSIFGFLVILGVVVDHTTEGISDSSQAMTYTEPKEEQGEL